MNASTHRAGESGVTIKELMAEATALGVPLADTRALLVHASGLRREQIVAFDERVIMPAAVERFRTLARRRAGGEPIAYLVGTREFFGRDFVVAPGVLIPRPETELLVEFALEHAAHGARVLDLGTGSGAIAISIAAERTDLAVCACERSVAALTVAEANNRQLAAARVELVRSDWFAALVGQRFDLIVSNPPYVRPDDPHLAQGDLRFEPSEALTDGHDGLSAIRAIVAASSEHLAPGGRLAVEHGYDQASDVRALFAKSGFSNVASRRDLAGIERITSGQRPPR